MCKAHPGTVSCTLPRDHSHGGCLACGHGLSVTQHLIHQRSSNHAWGHFEDCAAAGVILDPVYSGKALFNFVQDVHREPDKWQGRTVLFLHTGGLLGMYDKANQLQSIVEGLGRQHRMHVT